LTRGTRAPGGARSRRGRAPALSRGSSRRETEEPFPPRPREVGPQRGPFFEHPLQRLPELLDLVVVALMQLPEPGDLLLLMPPGALHGRDRPLPGAQHLLEQLEGLVVCRHDLGHGGRHRFAGRGELLAQAAPDRLVPESLLLAERPDAAHDL
jgi:hypothetical protein